MLVINVEKKEGEKRSKEDEACKTQPEENMTKKVKKNRNRRRRKIARGPRIRGWEKEI